MVTVSRKNNKYNKSMKWELVAVSPLGTIYEWYKTEAEAIEAKNKFDNHVDKYN